MRVRGSGRAWSTPSLAPKPNPQALTPPIRIKQLGEVDLPKVGSGVHRGAPGSDLWPGL